MWAVEGLKICTLMGSFCPNYAQFQLKSAEELSLMTLKGNGKFKEKLSCSFKHDIRSFADFHPTPQKFENFTSMGSFYRGVTFHDTDQRRKIWINLELKFLKIRL